jgi:hypothetical protein
MLPSAIPMMVIHRRVAAKRDSETHYSSRWFLTAYILTWAMFSIAATALQWNFQRADVLSHMLKIQAPLVGGGILIAAGIYQLTPLKAACLHKCRAPIGFLLTNWRSGRKGAFQMGLKHGQYCIGCCWGLMMVLFVGGVMSLATIAVLSGIVAIEKLAPRGEQISKLGGVLLIVWGLLLIFYASGGQPTSMKDMAARTSGEKGLRADLKGWCLHQPGRSDLHPFRDGKRIFKFNTEIAHRAVHLRVPKKQLDRAKIAGLLVDFGYLCPTE